MHRYRLDASWLGSSPSGRNPGGNNEHQVEHESTVLSHRIKVKLRILQKCGWQTEGSCHALLLGAVGPNLEHFIQFWVLQFHKNVEKLERFS